MNMLGVSCLTGLQNTMAWHIMLSLFLYHVVYLVYLPKYVSFFTQLVNILNSGTGIVMNVLLVRIYLMSWTIVFRQKGKLPANS